MSKYLGNLTDITADTECLKDLKMEKLEWLWPDRIPLGKITLLVGDPGLGKSFLSLDIAAHITTGRPWPDNREVPCRVGSVVLVTAEDDANDTVLPRLVAAKADIGKIHILRGLTGKFEGGGDRKMFFDLKKGIVALEHLKERIPDLALLVIDPITAYMGDINAHDNADVRSVLDKISGWASKNKVAVLGISHLNKNTQVGSKYRIMGSIAFVAIARMVWHVVEDKDDSDRKLLLAGKANVAPGVGGLAFRLQSVKVGEELIDSAVCEFEDRTVEETADEMREETIESLSSTKRKSVIWLKELLINGPMLAGDVYSAGKEEGFSESTLKRAKKILEVKMKKIQGTGEWEWIL